MSATSATAPPPPPRAKGTACSRCRIRRTRCLGSPSTGPCPTCRQSAQDRGHELAAVSCWYGPGGSCTEEGEGGVAAGRPRRTRGGEKRVVGGESIESPRTSSQTITRRPAKIQRVQRHTQAPTPASQPATTPHAPSVERAPTRIALSPGTNPLPAPIAPSLQRRRPTGLKLDLAALPAPVLQPLPSRRESEPIIANDDTEDDAHLLRTPCLSPDLGDDELDEQFEFDFGFAAPALMHDTATVVSYSPRTPEDSTGLGSLGLEGWPSPKVAVGSRDVVPCVRQIQLESHTQIQEEPKLEAFIQPDYFSSTFGLGLGIEVGLDSGIDLSCMDIKSERSGTRDSTGAQNGWTTPDLYAADFGLGVF